jgi:purine-binding chemotaxis protein CheW
LFAPPRASREQTKWQQTKEQTNKRANSFAADFLFATAASSFRGASEFYDAVTNFGDILCKCRFVVRRGANAESLRMTRAADSSIAGPNRDDAQSDAAAGLVEFISFAIGEDQYGVDIMSVREIKEWSNVTRLPRQPEYVSGVLNLRGVMVPVIDLRRRFGAGLTECTPTHIIIVVQINERQVGLLADRVLDIVSFDASKIQPVPRTAQSGAKFLSGLVTHEETMIALIDLRRLLDDDDENRSGGLAA